MVAQLTGRGKIMEINNYVAFECYQTLALAYPQVDMEKNIITILFINIIDLYRLVRRCDKAYNLKEL